jgi:hypothetical protein
MKIADLRYPPSYDRPGTEQWIRNAVLPNPIIWLPIRTNDAFLFANISVPPWLPTVIDVQVVVICADRGGIWQVPLLLKHSIEWARERKATKWHAQSDTEFDIGPLLRRVGAKLKPVYEVEL